MAFAIRRPTPPPPNGKISRNFFYPTFFLLQLNPTYMKRILHFKNITFMSSYNWFKIDIHQQLRPLTANYSAMSKVISTTQRRKNRKLSGFFQMTANFPDDFKTVRMFQVTANFLDDFKTVKIFPDDYQFSQLFQNCPDFPDDC